MRSTSGLAVFTTLARLSVLVVLASLAIAPAQADEILTYQMTSYNGTGKLIYDVTTNSLAAVGMEFGPTNNDWESGFHLGTWYLCCGSQGDSVIFFDNPNTNYPGYPSGPAEFSVETIPGLSGQIFPGGPIPPNVPVGYQIGSSGNYYISNFGNFGNFAASFTVISNSTVPEPSTITILAAGIICLWRVRRISKA